jgi:peptidase E
MKFFLASRANTPKTLEKLKTFLAPNKSIEDSKIIYIPTAANAEGGFGSWKDSDTLAMLKSRCRGLKIVELESCRREDILSEFDSADIIWMAGGYSGYLLYWIRLSQLDNKLPSLLKKGAVYIGSSAGAMACSKTQYSAELFDDAEYGASLMPGLGYLNFEIRPHYTDDMLENIKIKWSKTTRQ